MMDWELFPVRNDLAQEEIAQTASQIDASLTSGRFLAIAYAPDRRSLSTAGSLAQSVTRLERPYLNLRENSYLSAELLNKIDPREWFMWYQSIVNSLVEQAFSESGHRPAGLSLVVPVSINSILDRSKHKLTGSKPDSRRLET